MSDMVLLRDYGKRVGVKIQGKTAEAAREAVMKGIFEAASKAKAENNTAWIDANKDLVDWFNAEYDREQAEKDGQEAEAAPKAEDKPKKNGKGGGVKKTVEAPKAPAPTKGGKAGAALAEAKAKAEAAKAKAKEEKAVKKGNGGGGHRVDRKAQFSNKDFTNASQHLTYLFGQGTTQDAAVKALMKRWPNLTRCSTPEQTTALFKVHIKTLEKDGFKVVEKGGVYKAAVA